MSTTSRSSASFSVCARLLRTSPCVSSVPHGPPRARPPSLSGFDPPRGRPSSVGHSAPLITADLRSELPAACGGLSALQRPQPHVLVSGRQFARSLFFTHFPHESRACTARQVPAARAWVAKQVKKWALSANAQHAARELPPWPAPMAPLVGTNELGTRACMGVPPGRWCNRPSR